MDHYRVGNANGLEKIEGEAIELAPIEVVPEPPVATSPPRQRRVVLPLVLFVLTCASTFLARLLWSQDFALGLTALGDGAWDQAAHYLYLGIKEALAYAVPLMTILICHEAGHFFQARRYGVYASFPYFIPMPISRIGTMGAVIGMEAHTGDRKALFDIGISGPLAGLVPTLIFCAIGLHWSQVEAIPPNVVINQDHFLAAPLVFEWLADYMHGPTGPRQVLILHPMAFAGWVGLLITALNLFPIGQLDGGHILYGLLRRKAHAVATLVLLGSAAAVFLAVTVFHEPRVLGWSLMLVLLFLMGPLHPPTANDNVPLGLGRTILGWLTLAFLPFGFTPMPFSGL